MSRDLLAKCSLSFSLARLHQISAFYSPSASGAQPNIVFSPRRTMVYPHVVAFLPIFLFTLPNLALGSFSCGVKYFLKSANSGGYYTTLESSGMLVSTHTHKGWYQQFTVCRDSTWNPSFFVLKSEAWSSDNGKDTYIVKDQDGRFWTSTDTLTGNHLFQWAGGGDPYWGLVHAETGGYLSAKEEGSVYLGPKNLGWDQALFRET